MFYSHQLLARKASLGQIWMAATLHAKINRRKLNKINIIKICEEILNPSIPMALRLSGILMGGVVIVYERKVKLLYDDVSRLLVEINEAWKVKPAPDGKMLPKGKLQAKKEAVTLPDHQEADVEDVERAMNYSDGNTAMGFQQTAYFAMRLDSVNETGTNENPKEEVESLHFHQAEAANITLCERFDSFQTDRDLFNHFERFDIEGDDETQLNFASDGHTHISSIHVSSSPQPPNEPPRADEIHDQHPDDQINQPSDKCKEASQAKGRPGPTKKRPRRLPTFFMDYEQTIIPGHIYHSWIQNSSDIVSRRGRKRNRPSVMSTMKIADLMELPPVVLSCGLIGPSREIHYPAPLMELWTRSSQLPHESPSGRNSAPPPPEPSSSSPQERAGYQDFMRFPFEDYQTGVGSVSAGVPIEKQRAPPETNGMPSEIIVEGLRAKITDNNGAGLPDPRLLVTPGNSDEVRSIPSSGSAQGFVSQSSEVNSGRSNRKRPYSSSRNSSGGLEPVAEEHSWLNPDPNFRLSGLTERDPTPDQELLVETGPTQTPHPIISPAIDKLTDTIRTQMKAHFDTPGAPRVESLNHLASGMNRKGAAMLFYQTCVLATRDILKVEQKVPYGDILISKGAKM
ncbi:sister chromatid cohesion 1 protein 1 [Punica granatum]|uniref:Sister chromatid cohesion 1 protein 1 n=1 Tax=Punica granatum TaxID=22663 RepID=A0A6P8CFD5_PUNGR|nr:sister chromatid cohesion 1 protein 1 [Punica granatum]